jgi:hypothetical protein
MEVCFHIDVEKEYIFLCVKKWLTYSGKHELIPKLEFEYYVTESHKITKNGAKKASILHCLLEEKQFNQLSYDIYMERFHSFLQDTFVKVFRVKSIQ